MGILTIKLFIAFMYVFMIVMNFLANALPFYGRTTGEVSEQFPNLLTPAGFAFSIWGVIYILLGIAALRLLMMPADAYANASMRLFAYAFIASSLFNAVWLLAWHSLNVWLSLGVMTGLLLTLIIAYLQVPKHDEWLRFALSIYLGWISVAMILNITIALSTSGIIHSFSQTLYFMGVILLGVLLVAFMLLKRGDIPYALVFVWAYFALLMRHISEANVALYIVLVVAILALSFLSVWTFYANGHAWYGE